MRVLLAYGLLAFSLLPLQAASPLDGHIIVLDPGHGTIDFHGNIINSGKITRDGKTMEYKLTYEIARKLGKLIEEAGGRVIYTRTPHDYWRQASSVSEDNKARAILANELKADVYISIHCDWNPRSKHRGVTTYYKTPESRRLGEMIHRKMVRHLEAFDRRLRRDSYTVLDHTTMPSVLVETGFLSHRAESKKLVSAKYQTKIAEAIVSGLTNYFSN